MNYRLTFATAALAFALASYAEEPADTVKVIENARNVTVVKTGNTTIVKAEYANEDDETIHFQYELDVVSPDTVADNLPDDWGMDLPFMKTGCGGCETEVDGKHRVTRYVTGMRHIYWGWRFNYGDKGNVKNCFETGIRDVVGVSWKYRGAELEIGVGFSFRRYLAADGFSYAKEGDRLVIKNVADGFRCDKSRLDIATFQVPVLYNQRIGREFGFTIGGVMNFNSYAKAMTEIYEGDVKHKTEYKGLQQRLFTVEGMAAINVCGVGIYATWNPMKMFYKEFGPEVKSWAIGVDLNF